MEYFQRRQHISDRFLTVFELEHDDFVETFVVVEQIFDNVVFLPLDQILSVPSENLALCILSFQMGL